MKKKRRFFKGIPFGFVLLIYLIVFHFYDKILQIPFYEVIVVLLLGSIPGFILFATIYLFIRFMIGKLLRFKLINFQWFICQIKKENEKFHFSLTRKDWRNVKCRMDPPHGISFDKFAFYSVGGYFLTFLMGIVITAIVINLPVYQEPIHIMVLFLSGYIFTRSLFLILPDMAYEKHNGNILWGIILKKPKYVISVEINRLNSETKFGVRPRDFKLAFPVQYLMMKQYYNQLIDLKWIIALDSFDEEQIMEVCQFYEQNSSQFTNDIKIFYDYAILFAYCISRNEEKANQRYEVIKDHLFEDKDINGYRVKAYYEYYINYNKSQAEVYCKNGLDVFEQYPNMGLAIMEQGLIHKLLSKIEKEGA